MSAEEQEQIELVKSFVASPLHPTEIVTKPFLQPSRKFVNQLAFIFLKAGFTTIVIVSGKRGTTMEAARS